MASLYPTLFQLRHQYSKVATDQSLKYCSSLVVSILTNINKRFREYFVFSDSANKSALATISHPAFKLRWLAGQDAAVVT
jgi:hypothetical protein